MDDDWPLLMKGDCLLSAVACGSASQDFNFNPKEEDTPSYLSLTSPQQSLIIPDPSSDYAFNFGDPLLSSQKLLAVPADNFASSPPYSNTAKGDCREDISKFFFFNVKFLFVCQICNITAMFNLSK